MIIWRSAVAVLVFGVAWTQGIGSLWAATAETDPSSETGIVTISDDRSSAMFSLSGLEPGESDTRDITVTYTGSAAPAGVVLYVCSGEMTGNGLERYLYLTVERGSVIEGTGGVFSGSIVFSGTLEAFGKEHTSYADGAGLWMAGAPGAEQTFRFIVTLLDDNRAQGLDTTVAFTWEAQQREPPSQ